MTLGRAITACRTGLIREHYLYFEVMSPTAGLLLAAVSMVAGLAPNTVTFIGFLVAVPIVMLNVNGQLLGACALLHLFYAIDCADGILARASNRSSRAGAFLDDLAHCIVPPAFFLSLSFWAMRQSMARLAILAAAFAAIELAYRNVIQSMKMVPREASVPSTAAESGNDASEQTLVATTWASLVSSFHLPTASLFVTATIAWPEILTWYLGYASVAAFLYFLYAAFRVSSRLRNAYE